MKDAEMKSGVPSLKTLSDLLLLLVGIGVRL
jgi:hypothetical protein